MKVRPNHAEEGVPSLERRMFPVLQEEWNANKFELCGGRKGKIDEATTEKEID